MQTERFQSEGKRIMQETRSAEFPALSVDPRFRIFSACIGDRDLIIFLTYDMKNYYLSFVIPLLFNILRRITTIFACHFVVAHA